MQLCEKKKKILTRKKNPENMAIQIELQKK